ncbi:MAG: hypothetical protein WAN51_00005, partial [Alphaproteobacteria bacterium]
PMAKERTIRNLWMPLAALAAGIALAWAAPGHAADPQANDSGKIPLKVGQPQNPEPEDETLSDDEVKAGKAAFKNFHATVDAINENIADAYGGPPFHKVEYPALRTAKITPNKAWMDNKRSHYKNAMMLYSMWRNANQFRSVTLMILDDKGGDYITIKDTPQGIDYKARQIMDTDMKAAPQKPQNE